MRYVGLKSGFAAFGVFALVLSVGSQLQATTPPTTNFYLDGVGAGNVLAGVYTSPYNAVIGATLTGSGPTVTGGTAVPVICDDFASESFEDEDWTAYVTTLASLTAGAYGTPETQLKWGATSINDTVQAGDVSVAGSSVNATLTQVQAYDVAAILAIQIESTADATQLDELSYAMWALFDPTAALGQLGNGGGTSIETADEQQAIKDLKTAISDVCTSTTGACSPALGLSAYLSNYTVTIYSYTGGGTTCYGGTTSCPPPPQEFITVTAVPEASSLAMFAAYLLFGGGSLLFFGRRRMLRNR